VGWFFPKPLVRHPDTCEIISILYRADDWDVLGYYYPIMGEANVIEEEALLQLLHRYRASPKLIPFSLKNGIPNGAVTLWISVSDGGKIKDVFLGELNRMDVGNVQYTILGADSLLNEALELLEITEDIELPRISPQRDG